jgi:hypothetical protein
MLVPVFEISTFFTPESICSMVLLEKLGDSCCKNVSAIVLDGMSC